MAYRFDPRTNRGTAQMPASSYPSGSGDFSRYSRANANGGGYQPQPGRNFQVPKRKRRKWPWVVLIILILLLAAGGAAAYTAYNEAKALKSDAKTVMSDVNAVTKAIKDGDYDTASQKSKELAQLSQDIEKQLEGPVWQLAAQVPTYGQDVQSVKVVLGVLTDASNKALVPLTQELQKTPLSDLVRKDHSLDLDAMNSLLNAIQTTAPVFDDCAARMQKLPTFHIEQVQSMLAPASEKFTSINETVQEIAGFAPVMGKLLGAEGDRTYLLIAQNSSEIRSMGGFPGSVGTLTIVDGKFEMGDFTSCYDVFEEDIPESVGASATELSLFNSHVAKFGYTWDIGLNPDFPRDASIWKTAYEQKNDVEVDGVIGMTPSVIQFILDATGSITLSDGTKLDGSNATKVLQHDLYEKYFNGGVGDANEKTDELFAETASKAFDSLFKNMNAKTLKGVAQSFFDAMKTREFLMWMVDSDIQAKIVEVEADGALTNPKANSQLGVFYNDVSGSKLGWYIDVDTQIGAGEKQSDGSTVYSVTTTFANTITNSEARNGSVYIVSANGLSKCNLYLFAPLGGSISNLSSSDAYFGNDEYMGREVWFVRDGELAPQSDIVVTYNVTVPAGADELTVVKTPTLTEYR